MSKRFAILEIGSSNTKTHIYEDEKEIYDKTDTIEFKKNYAKEKKVDPSDIKKLYKLIDKVKEYTDNIYIYGCSIFRSMSKEELKEINKDLKEKYDKEIEVVTQEDEAYYTALGCFANIDYDGNICVFIGGGGSTELVFAKKGKIIDRCLYNFGGFDITTRFPSLKEDYAECTFDEVYEFVDSLVGDIKTKADVLILAGGDHLYWYKNAQYDVLDNTIYKDSEQPYMINMEMNDKYDRDALTTSLDAIRQRSDNPVWFDGSRAIKVTTNLISHKISAKYVVPTKINMGNGLFYSLRNK